MTYDEFTSLEDIIKIYDNIPGNAEGGSLHIILSDLNFNVSSAKFCVEWSLKNKDYLGAYIASELEKLGSDEKIKQFFEGEFWELDK